MATPATQQTSDVLKNRRTPEMMMVHRRICAGHDDKAKAIGEPGAAFNRLGERHAAESAVDIR